MDAIKTYLDNVFAAFPQSERVETLKREMLAGMEEKYRELKWEGMSEHEAIGSVIANFGSIDEIAAELGIEQSTSTAEQEDCWISLSSDDVDIYLEQTRSSGIWIGLGVWLILAGVGAMLLINGLTGMGATGIFVMLVAIAAAVMIFILNGIRMERYERFEEQRIQLDTQTRAALEEQSARFTTRFAVQISVGVAAIIIAVGALIFLGEQGYRTLPIVLLMFTIGFAVFLFVTAAYTKEAFDILLNQGEYRNKVANNKADRIIGTVASVYWPLAVVVYLLWSFIGDAWHISWLVWPVAGIAFGAISGGVYVWLSMGKEK